VSQIAEATLMDGRKIQYVIKDNPPRGGMKYTYFAPDKSYVVQFFNNPEVTNDPNLRKRIEAIILLRSPHNHILIISPFLFNISSIDKSSLMKIAQGPVFSFSHIQVIPSAFP